MFLRRGFFAKYFRKLERVCVCVCDYARRENPCFKSWFFAIGEEEEEEEEETTLIEGKLPLGCGYVF